MPFFSSQSLSATAAALVLSVLSVGAVAFAAVGYVEWSSNVNLAQFMSLKSEVAVAASDPALSLKGRTGCPQGNKMLPSTLAPLD